MNVFSGSLARRVLIVALIALTGVYLMWFGGTTSALAALLVFALPAAVLAMAALRGWRLAGFWAGVLALGWFSHGVMVAYTRPPERLFATLEVVLALAIVFAASLPGLKARFSKPKA
ncbi:DUF2069 domain-containing protein [Lysobacter tyrosinilyticus]